MVALNGSNCLEIYKGCPKINARFESNTKESFLDIYFSSES